MCSVASTAKRYRSRTVTQTRCGCSWGSKPAITTRTRGSQPNRHSPLCRRRPAVVQRSFYPTTRNLILAANKGPFGVRRFPWLATLRALLPTATLAGLESIKGGHIIIMLSHLISLPVVAYPQYCVVPAPSPPIHLLRLPQQLSVHRTHDAQGIRGSPH